MTTKALNTGGMDTSPCLDDDRKWRDAKVMMKWHFHIMVALCFILAFGIVVSVGGVIYIGQQSKYVPYAIVLKEDGSFMYGGEIKTLEKIPSNTLHRTVSSFIEKIRLVTPDVFLQAEAIRDVYKMVSKEDPAYVFLDEWYKDKEKNPFERSSTETVHAEIKSVLPLSPETLQVDWVDKYRTRAGALVKAEHMRALVSVYIGPLPKNEEEARRNPNRVFVQSISWSPVL